MSVELSDVRSVVARVATLLVMAFAMLVLPELTTDPGVRAILPGFCLLIFLYAAPALWSRQPDLFAPPVYHGIVTAFGSVATMAGWIVNDELTLDLVTAVRTDELVAYAQKALLILLLGTASYYAGYYSRFGAGWSRIFPRLRGLAWARSRVLFVCAAAFAAFIVAYGVFQSRVGVSIFDLTQLGAGKAVWRDDPTMSWMMRGIELGFLPVMLYVSYTLSAKTGLRSLLVPALLLAAVALLGSRVGQRGSVFFVLVAILVQFHYNRARIPTALFMALSFVGIVSSNIMLEWRNEPEEAQRSFDLVERAADPLVALSEHESERQRFSSVVLIAKEFPETVPYLMGESWVGVVALFVPRWLWPEKVEHFEWMDHRIIRNLVGANTPANYMAVFYANLSWLGVILGPLLYGLFHRGLYEWLRRSGRDRNTILLYSLFLVYFAPSMLNLSASIQYILPAWLMLKLVSRPPDGTPETI